MRGWPFAIGGTVAAWTDIRKGLVAGDAQVQKFIACCEGATLRCDEEPKRGARTVGWLPAVWSGLDWAELGSGPPGGLAAAAAALLALDLTEC